MGAVCPLAFPTGDMKLSAKLWRGIVMSEKTRRHMTHAKASVKSDDRHRMIAEAAYYLAERQGFGGDPENHWLEAERQIDRMLNGAKD